MYHKMLYILASLTASLASSVLHIYPSSMYTLSDCVRVGASVFLYICWSVRGVPEFWRVLNAVFMASHPFCFIHSRTICDTLLFLLFSFGSPFYTLYSLNVAKKQMGITDLCKYLQKVEFETHRVPILSSAG